MSKKDKASTRRKAYSGLKRSNEVISSKAKGMGDVVFKGFQCLDPDCKNMIFVKESDLLEDFDIQCECCGFHLRSGDYTSIFDYDLHVDGQIVDSGVFDISHDRYLESAGRYKYCTLCKSLKPMEHFGTHNSRKSKKQGECKLCKDIYNGIKNGTRKSDQHREASQRRRLLFDVSGNVKIDSKKIYKKYNYKCFCCGEDLSKVSSEKERPLDHTLPVYYLWSLNTDNATLLCQTCNGEKSGKWPSEYYSATKIRELSVKTGFDYELLSGAPVYNPEAIEKLKDTEFVDNLLIKYARYMEKTIIPLRNRLLNTLQFDMFEYSTEISDEWIEIANSKL